MALNHFPGSGQVWAYAFGLWPVIVGPFITLNYKHSKEIYMICILIEITSWRLSSIVLVFIVIFLFVYSCSMFSTLPIACFVLHVLARVVNLGPVYTIPGSGFPGILDL